MKRVLSLFLLIALVLTALPMSVGAASVRTPIYVGNLAVDYMAQQILAQLPLEGKSDVDQIGIVYDWIIANGERHDWDGVYRFDPTQVQTESQKDFARDHQEKLQNGEILLRRDWEETSGLCGTDYFDFSLDSTNQVISQAYNMMLKMTGSCAAFTSLFTVLLGHMGYDSRQFHGDFINMDGTQVEHTWNYVLIDGTWYWFDIRIDHAIGGGRQYFMKQDTESWAKEHIWRDDQSLWLVAHTEEIQALYAANDADPFLETPVTEELPAPDVTPPVPLTCSPWASGYMEDARSFGLIPTSMLTLDLSLPITRQEFAAVAVAMYDAFTGAAVPSYEGTSPFSDCSDAQVLNAYQLGIVNGMGDGTFAPHATLTREQAAAMLGRVYELASQGVIFGGEFLPQGTEEFSDHGDIFDYAKNYIYFFTGTGVINGMGDNTFAPKGTMTREQALKISVVCLQNL
ncbi:MAG: S-layer homology domain-containing protein [Oscillospiraceae bacterium]|nr:S-layer homology domain-containing protein [Oscillospiraceae bacterium]